MMVLKSFSPRCLLLYLIVISAVTDRPCEALLLDTVVSAGKTLGSSLVNGLATLASTAKNVAGSVLKAGSKAVKGIAGLGASVLGFKKDSTALQDSLNDASVWLANYTVSNLKYIMLYGVALKDCKSISVHDGVKLKSSYYELPGYLHYASCQVNYLINSIRPLEGRSVFRAVSQVKDYLDKAYQSLDPVKQAGLKVTVNCPATCSPVPSSWSVWQKVGCSKGCPESKEWSADQCELKTLFLLVKLNDALKDMQQRTGPTRC